MATISIAGTDHPSYSTICQADAYYSGSTDYETWISYDSLVRERALISATRIFERMGWLGTKVDDDQTLAFPRSGLTDCQGEDVTEAQSLARIAEATQLLALDLLEGSTAGTSIDGEDRTKRLKADTVEIEYFRADSFKSTRFQADIMGLVGCFMAGAGAALSGSIAYGTDGVALDNDFSITGGF